MCHYVSFSPSTFYLRVPECDIQCIRVPKINNLRAEPLTTKHTHSDNLNRIAGAMTHMPGAHSFTIQLSLINFTRTMAQDQWTLQEKKKVKSKTGARAATAGPCCSCQQDSPYNFSDDPGAHGNEQGGGGKAKLNGAG